MQQKNTTNIDKLIGANIKYYRGVRHQNRGTVANALGITIQQMAKYEQGINRITASRLYEISNILSIPIIDFFGKNSITYKTIDTKIINLINNYNLIENQTLKQDISNIVRALGTKDVD